MESCDTWISFIKRGSCALAGIPAKCCICKDTEVRKPKTKIRHLF